MAHVVPSTLLAWCPIVRLASDGKMIFKSLSVGSLYTTRRIPPTTSTSGSGLEIQLGGGRDRDSPILDTLLVVPDFRTGTRHHPEQGEIRGFIRDD